jgi:hypothetical protein
LGCNRELRSQPYRHKKSDAEAKSCHWISPVKKSGRETQVYACPSTRRLPETLVLAHFCQIDGTFLLPTRKSGIGG